MPSIRSHLLIPLTRLFGKRRLAEMEFTLPNLVAMRARLEQLGDRGTLPAQLSRDTHALGGVVTEWTRHAAGGHGTVLYCHGGAYAVGSPKVYRGLAARLAVAAGCDVAAIDYRLAPEHIHPAAPDDAIAAYEALLAHTDPRSIVIAGDSAGGNLTLATLLRIRDRGMPAPAGAVLLSPWTDLTGSGESMHVNARRDPMLPAQRVAEAAVLYAPHSDHRHPDVSPLFGDFSGLPPLDIHVGSTEILLDDSRRLASRARAAGVDATLTIWPRMPHVFPIFADFLPEGRRAIDHIAAFISARLSATQETAAA